MSASASPPQLGQRDPLVPRSWATVTVAALILSGLGLVFGMASGIGLPFALAGTICGVIAMRLDRPAKPWPLIALIAGAVGSIIAAVVLVVLAVRWLPLLPELLFG